MAKIAGDLPGDLERKLLYCQYIIECIGEIPLKTALLNKYVLCKEKVFQNKERINLKSVIMEFEKLTCSEKNKFLEYIIDRYDKEV